MKKTYLLATLFFAGLAALWWLDYARIPRAEERLARMNRVLGGLFDTRAGEVRRIEILRDDQALTFERRDGGHWQMVKPIDAAADPAMVENLIRNLIDLSRSPDVGTITEPGRSYGLEPPAAVVRVVGTRSPQSTAGAEIDATLEIGASRRDVRFVRPRGENGIEAVDGKLLKAIDLPPTAWREKVLLRVPTFQVVGLSVRGADSAYGAARSRTGHWVLREPVAAPADGLKIENILAGLSSLRVTGGNAGYVADDVRDFSKYGLDPPELTVTLKTAGPQDKPVVLEFGKPVADHPDRVYAKRGDQDDVILVDTKFLTEIPRRAKELRVGKVAVFEPRPIVRIGIDAPAIGCDFSLRRTATGWEQLEPNTDRVDSNSIRSLIETLDGLESSELLDFQGADDLRMSPRAMTIRLWQQGRPGSRKDASPAEPPPALSLEIGRRDALRKTVYGRLEGDSVILTLPDSILEVLPKNSFAFRDRGVLALNPGSIKSLRIQHDDQAREVVPSTTSERANAWKMTSPVEGNVDMPTLSRIFASLSALRAEEFVVEAKDGDTDRQFGLGRPSVEMTWETESHGRGRLRIGGRVGRASAFYACLDGLPMIFTLDAATVGLFRSELRDQKVFSFDAARAFKVVLRWPERTMAFLRRPGSSQAAATWMPDPATDTRGIDVARLPEMLSRTAQLQTIRFLQYEGVFPVSAGLTPPRLTIEIHLVGDPSPRILRIGNTREGEFVHGATGDGDRGPVFFLPAAAWNQLVESGDPMGPFPDDVFAPASRLSGNDP
jgi:hypothetical protein